jgi:cobalamin biosynthesis protein CobT
MEVLILRFHHLIGAVDHHHQFHHRIYQIKIYIEMNETKEITDIEMIDATIHEMIDLHQEGGQGHHQTEDDDQGHQDDDQEQDQEKETDETEIETEDAAEVEKIDGTGQDDQEVETETEKNQENQDQEKETDQDGTTKSQIEKNCVFLLNSQIKGASLQELFGSETSKTKQMTQFDKRYPIFLVRSKLKILIFTRPGVAHML